MSLWASLAAVVLLAGCGGAPKAPRVALNGLNAAVQNGDAATVHAELAAGADPCAKDADGVRALSRLMYHPELADAVLAKALERDCPETLYFAAHHGKPEIVRLLLERGVGPESAMDGLTPLSGAAHPVNGSAEPERPGQLEAAKLLIAKGADPNAKGGEYAPLWYALANHRNAVAKLLVESGADPNARGYPNEPVLATAMGVGRDPAVARLLIEKGADPETAIAHLEALAAYWQGQLARPHAGAMEQNNLQFLRNAIARIQRLAAEGRAASSPAAGVSKEELTKIVQAAVHQAAAAPKPAAARIVSDVDRPAYRKPERPDDLAIVVGVEKYSDLPEARFAERDAETVKDYLIAAGFASRNVVLLSGEKASRSAIEKFVETLLPRNAKEASQVVFYFSGHGAPDPVSGKAYLVPWDGDPGFLENTAYPLSRLYEKLGGLPARSVVALIDSCFSGAGGRSVLARGARPLVLKSDSAAPSGRLVVLTAAAGDEIASTSEEQGHGLFTYHLLKGFGGEAGGGPLTAAKLHAYLKPKVQDAARRLNRSQTPTLLGANPALVILP